MGHVKDPSRITLVGCSCQGDRKRAFADQGGFCFRSSECGGDATLGKIVREALASVPPEPSPITGLTLRRVFKSEPVEDGFFHGRNSFTRFASMGSTLFAGRSDGRVFARTRGTWAETPMKLAQGVNVLTVDGKTLLAGDGSCCSGAIWRLKGKQVEQLIPVDDDDPAERDGNKLSAKVAKEIGDVKGVVVLQGEPDTSEKRSRDLKGNVYGIARFQGELLAGGGGCDGTHLFRLNAENRWEFHPEDPVSYILGMQTLSDGNVLILFLDGRVARYDGHVHFLGRVASKPRAIGEHDSHAFIGSTESGSMHPTSFSTGTITRLDGDRFVREWSGPGGIDGFFTLGSTLFAWGADHRDWSTIVLRRDTTGSWTLVAKTTESIHLFVHDGVLIAGGREEATDGSKDGSAAVIWEVDGITT